MKILVTSDTHRGFSKKTHSVHARWAEELSREEWDVLVLAGDIGTASKRHFLEALAWWRRLAGDRPIMLSRGNHDLWDRRQRNLVSLREILHHQIFSDLAISHLESGGPVYLGDVCFVGWDGWYALRPSTNDLYHMARFVEGDTWSWLQREALHGFQRATSSAEEARKKGYKVVAVTHFPITGNPDDEAWSGSFSWWPHISPHLDLLVQGHSHTELDVTLDGARVVNTGSDYDRPRAKIIEI